jgi:hypothetical protein
MYWNIEKNLLLIFEWFKLPFMGDLFIQLHDNSVDKKHKTIVLQNIIFTQIWSTHVTL